MSLRTLGMVLTAALLQWMAATASAQTYDYHVYIDSDLRNTSGCSVSGGGQTFAGAEYRLTATVTGSPPMVTARTLSTCAAGSFGPGTALSANYPVGRNNGLPLAGGAAADVIEVSIARAQLPGVEPQVRVGFGTQSASGSIDVLYTTDGNGNGLPMVVGSPALIPTLGFFGGLLLALALAALALRSLKQNRLMAQMLLVGAFFSLGLAAWAAANHIADGQVGDWAGEAPIGMDTLGDSVPPLSGTDIVGAFGADERPNLHFRIDVVDAENRPPVAVNDSYSTLEDTVLTIAAPGVLGNDSDPDGNPITAQLVSGPTRGTLVLNVNGSFSYTPNANLNGPDSFTYNAFDGQVTSVAPATVTLDVTPVNDVPVFTAGPNQTVLEDAGAQTVNPWASGIGDGDPEVVQALTFNITGNTNAALFSAAPAVSPTGVLTYTPAANANGVATITLNLMDDGDTANGGVDTSPPQSFTITVTPVNDAPSFTAGANQTVLEDAGAQTVTPWATAISAGPPDEAGQVVSFEITNNSNPTLFSAGPAVNGSGTLSYTAAANANGVATISVRARDDGGSANGGIDASAPQTFTITVTGVNDVPVFTAGPNQTVLEDAGPQTANPWATGIDDGDPEVVQNLSFNITGNTNAALFSAAPAVSPTGVLSYTPAANANGVATITLRLMDDGGSANGGIDLSAPQSFTITVTPVNDAPTLTASNPPTVLEDAAPVSIPAWATFNPGAPDEAGQTVLGYQISAISNAALFAAPPAVANNGTLSYTLAANANGSSTFVARVQDSGGTANGGIDLSAPQTFTITVTAVNDVPSFTKGPDQSVLEDAGPQIANPWATAISAGPPDEAGQSLTFNITANTNAALFSAGPAVSPTGALTYTPAANANGVATITLNIMDNGGTANGGIDFSAPQSFTITVIAVNDAPVNSMPGPQSGDEDAFFTFTGPALISVSDIDIGGGNLSVNLQVSNGTLSLTAAGGAVINNNGTAAVAVSGLLVDVNASLASLSYSPVANFNGADTLNVSSNDNGNTGVPGPLSDNDSVNITINPVNDGPINSVPGTQTVAGGMLVFSSVNTNTISVLDIDANPGNVQVNLSVTAGTLNAVVTPGVVISNNSSAALTLVGLQANVNTAMDGLMYVPSGGGTDTLTVLSSDLGNTGLGGPLTDSDTVTLLIDEAPMVTMVSPSNGATQQANNVNVVVTFSEQVNTLAGAVSVNCAPSGANASSTAQSNVGSITLTGASIGAANGDVCSVLVTAASVSDVDAIDPPDLMAANFNSSYTIDLPPAFVSSIPANAATVANTAVFAALFSEPVNFGMGGFTLNCGGPIAVTPSGSGTSTLTFTPAAPLPSGSSCTATLIAANITDVDAGDPPDNLPANIVVNFTVDAAPGFVSAIPAAAAVVGTGQVISFTFDEPVNNLGAAITLNCGSPVAGVIGGSGSATLSFTPSAALTPGASCTATAVAAQIGDVDLIDPPQNPIGDVVRNFTVDLAPTVLSTNPSNGAINVPLAGVVTFNFSEPVNFVAGSFTYSCGAAVPFNVAGSGTSTATLTPTGLLPINTACTVTALAAGISDVDSADPPDTMVANVVVNFTSVNDNPPAVAASTPANGATVANNTPLSITFSENIDATAGSVTLTCGGPNLITGGTTGTNVSSLAPTYTPPLTNGASCTLTVLAANITDSDLIDPPDNMVANFVSTFTVDAAPSVSSVLPGNGASNLATNTTITVNFSEAVNVAAGGVTLGCPGAVSFNAGVLPATNVTSLVLTPSAPLPEGATCNGTVVATLVTDNDAIDPPDQMVTNFAWSFTTDAAPTVTTVTPAAAAVVPSNQLLTINFSENVDLSASAFTLNCGAAVPFSSVPALPATATNTITLTPTGGLAQGSACTLTVVAAQVSDSDLNDPPNNMAANFVRSFSVDAAPSVTTTTPANGATAVDPTTNITINFSESVSFDTTANAANTSFDLECPAATPVNFTVVTASPAASVVLNPLDSGVAGATCTLSVRAAAITDADAIDPPDNMLADFTASFTYAAVANDDAYNVTPHLTLGIGAASPQGGGVLVNDILGAGVITGFGFSPSCTGTAPGAQLDAGAANGRLTLNANGSFSYEPPAGIANSTRTFCYTVTGGDTANVVFTLQNTELVWFVDAAAPAGGIGTQARPFQTLAGADAVDTADDTIHLAFNASSYTSIGLTLLANERLVGSGSGSTLAAISGVTPIAGSAFPALGGSAPTITCAGISCVTLGTNNVLRGFTIGNSGAAGTDLAGTNFGILTVGELTLNGDGRALNLATGTLNGTFLDLDASSSNNQGISLSAVGGTWTVTAQSAIGNVSGTAVNIVSTPAGGSATFTGGLVVNKPSAGAGINLNANAAPINLGNLSVTTGSGTALTADNSTGTLTTTAGSLTATGGAALNSTGSALNLTLTSASSTNSPTQGINLNNLTGTVTISGGSLNGSTGTAFLAQGTLGTTSYAGNVIKASAGRLIEILNGASGNVTLSGNLSCTLPCGTGSGPGLLVNGRTGGNVTFSGASKVFNASGADLGVSLTGNAGATIDFINGGLAVATTNGTGFNATGGGTVSVQGSGNTVSTGTGAAINIASTTISASNVTFQSVSTTTAVNGIVLNGTGNNGGLVITGNGGACTTPGTCTGGAIQISSGPGVSLTNTRGFSATRLYVGGGGDDGISGSGINGFTLNNSVVSNNGNAANESGIDVTQASGAWSITNTTLNQNYYDVIRIANNSGSMSFDMSGSTLTNNDAVNGNSGLLIDLSGSAALTSGSVSSNTITGIRVIPVQVLASGGTSSVAGLVFDGNVTRNGQIAYDLSAVAPASMQYIVRNQTGAAGRIQGMNSHGFNGNYGVPAAPTSAGTYRGRIQNVDIGDVAIVGSGSAIGNCMRLVHNRDASSAVIVNGGTMRQCVNGRGIDAISRDAGAAFVASSGLDLQVLSTNINTNDTSGFPLASIIGQASTGGGGGNRARLDFRSNTTPPGSSFDIQTGFIIAHENTASSDCQVVDPPPANANATAALSALENANVGSATGSAGCSLIAGPLITPP